MDDLFKDIEGFEWDEGNIDKNWRKHKVTNKESEEVFADKRFIFGKDVKHSTKEPRYLIYGKSKSRKHLSLAFTFRNSKIRIISSRLMSKKERTKYDQKKVK